jgi:hypothetical protein
MQKLSGKIMRMKFMSKSGIQEEDHKNTDSITATESGINEEWTLNKPIHEDVMAKKLVFNNSFSIFNPYANNRGKKRIGLNEIESSEVNKYDSDNVDISALEMSKNNSNSLRVRKALENEGGTNLPRKKRK